MTKLLTKQMLAERMTTSTRTIDNLRRRGVIPAITVGRIVRFDTEAVEEALKRFTTRTVTLKKPGGGGEQKGAHEG